MSTTIIIRRSNPSSARSANRPQPSRPMAAPNGRTAPLYREQIHALVQQLFLQPEGRPVRHAALASADGSSGIEQLCCDAAVILSECGTYDVGLIDADPWLPPLGNRLGLEADENSGTPRMLRPHLWLVPRARWAESGESQIVTELNLARLRKITAEFDFSILCCPAFSWSAARIGSACDGLVLVLTAHKTRRMAASRIQEQLRNASVPLLGTVLTERRFPIPSGIYRRL